MTIAIIGPEKFAFQDLVCVDLALAALEDGPRFDGPGAEGQ